MRGLNGDAHGVLFLLYYDGMSSGYAASTPPLAYRGEAKEAVGIHPLAECHKEGTCCLLETFEEKNLSFYQRHGFQVVAAEIEPYSQLRFWTMSRPPRTSP